MYVWLYIEFSSLYFKVKLKINDNKFSLVSKCNFKITYS